MCALECPCLSEKNSIIKYLKGFDWVVVDVESELLSVRDGLKADGIENVFELGTKIKEWFNSKPSKLILINASILYHDMFLKISPVGAFKYNSRNKNCVLFLEDESRLGKKIYHGKPGTEDYYDQEINDIVLANINEISEDFTKMNIIREEIKDYKALKADAIGHLFNFQQIKDVVDIDADLEEYDKQRELVNSYVISKSLENQIVEFFENLDKPNHKASTVIGNYGSGKSHIIGFLISLVEEPALAEEIKNERIKRHLRRSNENFILFSLNFRQVRLN
jgi:hypothetical protein